jgi:phosphoribosylglycinamide formyltransferase-1
MASMTLPIRLGVLLSGGGRTLQNLIDRIADGTFPARIQGVVSSTPKAFGLERARTHNLPAAVVDRKAYPDAASFSEAVTRALESISPLDLVVMAGFVHLYLYPAKWERRILNIHPALLPEFGGKGFYGHKVHEAVLRAGARESGCTVHYADHRYDHGSTILQRRIPVLPGDTPDSLADRVFREECLAYPEAILRVAEGKA